MAQGFFKKEGKMFEVVKAFGDRAEELTQEKMDEAIAAWPKFVEEEGGVSSIKGLLNSCSSKGAKLGGSSLAVYPWVVE